MRKMSRLSESVYRNFINMCIKESKCRKKHINESSEIKRNGDRVFFFLDEKQTKEMLTKFEDYVEESLRKRKNLSEDEIYVILDFMYDYFDANWGSGVYAEIGKDDELIWQSKDEEWESCFPDAVDLANKLWQVIYKWISDEYDKYLKEYFDEG